MITFWALLDMSAHARGGYVSLCTHNCSPNFASVIGGTVLTIGAFAIVKSALVEAFEKRDLKTVAIMFVIVLFAVAALIGALVLGPIPIILGIIGMFFAWHKLTKMNAKNPR